MPDNTTNQPLKRCSKCGVEKPATTEYFLPKKDKTKLCACCRECRAIYSRAWKANNHDKVQEYNRVYYSENSEREKARSVAYQKAHPEKTRALARAYQKRHLDGCRERERRWRERNPDAARARSNRYYHAHSEQRKIATKLRRSKATGSYSAADIEKMYKHQHGKCYYCQASLKNGYHVDHVVPLSRGGTNDVWNLVLACPPCNWSKNDRMPHEWAKGGRLL